MVAARDGAPYLLFRSNSTSVEFAYLLISGFPVKINIPVIPGCPGVWPGGSLAGFTQGEGPSRATMAIPAVFLFANSAVDFPTALFLYGRNFLRGWNFLRGRNRLFRHFQRATT